MPNDMKVRPFVLVTSSVLNLVSLGGATSYLSAVLVDDGCCCDVDSIVVSCLCFNCVGCVRLVSLIYYIIVNQDYRI